MTLVAPQPESRFAPRLAAAENYPIVARTSLHDNTCSCLEINQFEFPAEIPKSGNSGKHGDQRVPPPRRRRIVDEIKALWEDREAGGNEGGDRTNRRN